MEQITKDLWALVVEEAVVHGIRHLLWATASLVVVMLFGLGWRRLRSRVRDAESESRRMSDRIEKLEQRNRQPTSQKLVQTITGSFNVTNNIIGSPKRGKLTGKFYVGSMFHPNLLQETMYPTVLVPEILIEQEDGTQEVLNIGGYKVVDDLGKEVRNDIEISDGFVFQLGRPDEPARLEMKVAHDTDDRGDD